MKLLSKVVAQPLLTVEAPKPKASPFKNPHATITGNGFLNPGTVEAGAGGEVSIFDTTVKNAGGTIEAIGGDGS